MARVRYISIVVITLLMVLTPMACSNSPEGAIPTSEVETLTPVSHNDSATVPQSLQTPIRTVDSFSISAFSDAIADVVEQVEPSVVFILAEIAARGFFGQETTQTSSGSGVIVSSDGYILTNNHVIQGARRIEATLTSIAGTFEAELIGTDPLTDLAVIKIKGDDFPATPFGDVEKLRPGNLVIAIGNPLGLEGGPTMTLGVVSNTERSFTMGNTTYYDVIQTDAAINPGNSGGPLVDLNGAVIGINTVLAGGAQNIGFAISVNTAKPIYETLIAPPHRVIRPWLGVVLQTVTPDLAAQADLPVNTGAVIVHVEENSPAARAGLLPGDVITQFQGKEVTEATQVTKDLWAYQVGEEVTVNYQRGDEVKDLTIVLSEERPAGT